MGLGDRLQNCCCAIGALLKSVGVAGGFNWLESHKTLLAVLI